MWLASVDFPVDTGRKLNVHKTFRRRPVCLLNVLCTFNLRPVSTGLRTYKQFFLTNCVHFWNSGGKIFEEERSYLKTLFSHRTLNESTH